MLSWFSHQRHPAIRSCAPITIESPAISRILCAYCTCTDLSTTRPCLALWAQIGRDLDRPVRIDKIAAGAKSTLSKGYCWIGTRCARFTAVRLVRDVPIHLLARGKLNFSHTC